SVPRRPSRYALLAHQCPACRRPWPPTASGPSAPAHNQRQEPADPPKPQMFFPRAAGLPGLSLSAGAGQPAGLAGARPANTKPARRASGAQGSLAPAHKAPQYGHGQPGAHPSHPGSEPCHRGPKATTKAAVIGGASAPDTITTVTTSRPGDDAAKRLVMEERAWRRAARNGQELAETALEAPRLRGPAHVG